MITDSQPGSGVDVARIAELADRYGAALAHWPRTEADAARRLLAESSAARAVLTRSIRLDEILSETRTLSVSIHLRDRILAAAPERGWRELLSSLWPFGPVWRPATALLGITLFGAFLGSTDAATLGSSPISVNAALSEEIRLICLSAAEVLDEGPQWPK